LVAPVPHLVAETVRRERLAVRRHAERQVAAWARRDDVGQDRQHGLVGHLHPYLSRLFGDEADEPVFYHLLAENELNGERPRLVG
jgi:hypothetical protein